MQLKNDDQKTNRSIKRNPYCIKFIGNYIISLTRNHNGLLLID